MQAALRAIFQPVKLYFTCLLMSPAKRRWQSVFSRCISGRIGRNLLSMLDIMLLSHICFFWSL